jgi:hypothetical protein
MDTHPGITDVPGLERLQQRALAIGAVGVLAAVAGAFLNPDQFFR